MKVTDIMMAVMTTVERGTPIVVWTTNQLQNGPASCSSTMDGTHDGGLHCAIASSGERAAPAGPTVASRSACVCFADTLTSSTVVNGAKSSFGCRRLNPKW